ncbi:hypothetical protein EDD11_001517 [Mortierella claussenii]|nr:hypothetical protein EDD11_001517 [Mortierella claussenii]
MDATLAPDEEHLHAIVGQHLALAPALPELSADSPAFSSPATPPADIPTPVHPYEQPQQAPAASSSTSLTATATPDHTMIPVQEVNAVNVNSLAEGSNTMPGSLTHFNLLGADVANDVYKWHEKESRRQIGRAQTYHAPTEADPDITNIKAPGGFRRHFIQHDAAARGIPAPHFPTKSFIHFLGLFNMYEFEHFAGENLRQKPRKSIVVPRDPAKRRQSLAESNVKGLKVFKPGQYVDEDEEVIEEPEEKISFSKAVGMLFKTGYCIFFAQQFAIVVDSLGGAKLDKIVWIAIFFVILVPFTLVRNISKLGFSTLVADVCIIVGLIYLYAYDIKELVINNGSPSSLQLFNSKDFGLFIGTAVFSYEGIGMVIPICGSMANPKQFPRALTIVLTIVCMLLVSFGTLGYAAYGETVHTIVLDNLPHETGGEKAGKNAIQLLYIIAIFLTTPLMLFPCIRIIEHVVFRTVGEGPPSKTRLLKENIVRVVIDLAVAAVAYAGYSKLDIFISFVGSFACAPLLFIFPPLFHLKAFPGQPVWRKISDAVLILFGFAVFFYTLYITIKSFSNKPE